VEWRCRSGVTGHKVFERGSERLVYQCGPAVRARDGATVRWCIRAEQRERERERKRERESYVDDFQTRARLVLQLPLRSLISATLASLTQRNAHYRLNYRFPFPFCLASPPPVLVHTIPSLIIGLQVKGTNS